MFAIGNFVDSDKLYNISKEITYGGGGYKLYGVKFDYNSSSNRNIGERTYNAKDLQFVMSTPTVAGTDDFINLENGNSPFGIKECATKYNASTGKQEIMTYKGQSDWESALEDPEHNRMIEFPKFYYKRPSKFEWVVSKDPFPGSSPSPMHYRNGVMHDKWYISKYVVDKNCRSQSDNTDPDAYSDSFINFRNKLIEKGLFMLDFATKCTLQMLAFIKYNNLYRYCMADGYGSKNRGACDNILGVDGYTGNAYHGSSPLIFGIENLYNASVHYVVAVAGVTGYNYTTNNPDFNNAGSATVAINTDIEAISKISDCSDLDLRTGYTELEQYSISGNGNPPYFERYRLSYNPSCDWALYVTGSDGTDESDAFMFSNKGISYDGFMGSSAYPCKLIDTISLGNALFGFGQPVAYDSYSYYPSCVSFSQCYI